MIDDVRAEYADRCFADWMDAPTDDHDKED